jgi:hypothetical protein
MAASNSAEVEKLALSAGVKKGGAAKGELVLAMYELANCFRNGWGIKKDPVAAKQYYETAANLGDTDAMNEVAWCYLEGFGTKKDKVRCISSILYSYPKVPFSVEGVGIVHICFTGRRAYSSGVFMQPLTQTVSLHKQVVLTSRSAITRRRT